MSRREGLRRQRKPNFMTENLPEKNPENSLDALLPKQRMFLFLLTEGRPVFEAYKAAGYEGEKGAAYQLKSRLDGALVEMAKARNVSKGDLMLEIGRLNDLPLVDRFGDAVVGITINHKIKVLALQQKALESEKQEAPRVTLVQVNRFEAKTASEVEAIATEAEVVLAPKEGGPDEA